MTGQPTPAPAAGHTVGGGTFWHSGPRAGCTLPGCRPGDAPDTPATAPAPVGEALVERVARVIDEAGGTYANADADTVAAAVLAELGPELSAVQMYSEQSAANARYRLEIDRLTGLLARYANRAIENGKRAERAEAELAPLRREQETVGRFNQQATADRRRAEQAESALAEAEARITQALAVAEVIDANGIGWAADSIRRALDTPLPAEETP